MPYLSCSRYLQIWKRAQRCRRTDRTPSIPVGIVEELGKCVAQWGLQDVGKHQEPLTELEMEFARVKRELAEVKMERDLFSVVETARGRGKSTPRTLVAVALSLSTSFVQASPIGGMVASGTGAITQNGSITTITQSSQNLSLNWQSFNIAKTETVNFLQPSAAAIAVNRIYDTNGTTILGHLNANGQVWLINPNGILFGAGAQVNVGGLVASTLATVSNNGSATTFSGNGAGSLANNGTINGHYVAFIGNAAVNNGTIASNLGAVALGAGNRVTLTFAGINLVKMQVDASVLNSLAANGGLISANGGMVILTAGARDSLLASVVNNTGVIEARTVDSHDGTITLLGGMTAGAVNVGGTLDASAPNGGNGGFIETSAAHVKVANNASVTTKSFGGKTGEWLVDPQDYTIATSGGDMTGAALTASLNSTSVVLQSSSGGASGSGNINIDDVVSWSANTLTLTAANNVNINAVMTTTGSGSLTMNPSTANGADPAVPGGQVLAGMNKTGFIGRVDFSGTGTLSISGNTYTVINSLGTQGSMTGTDLQGMNGNLSGYYALGSNIDATPSNTWNNGSGFKPIGYGSVPSFTGTFNGLGHIISNMVINSPSATSPIGLFSGINHGGHDVILNTGIAGGNFTGGSHVGSLIGWQFFGLIENDYSTATVSGVTNVGGVTGYLFDGLVKNVFTTGMVTGSSNNTGGVVGYNAGTVTDVWSSSSVTDYQFVGGVIGINYGTASYSYATGPVDFTYKNAGGFAGTNNGLIEYSYATGNVTGSNSGSGGAGGFVGANSHTINNSYATGNVVAAAGMYGGGFAGINYSTITNSWSSGSVSGSGTIGGLAGANSSTISNSYWDTTTSGLNSSYGGTGMTTANMQTQANFSGWDFAGTWAMYDGHTYPLLRAFMTPLTVTAGNVTKTYDGAAFSGGSVTYSVAPNANLLGTLVYGGSAQGAKNVGTYAITPTGLYSNQQGYIITVNSGTLMVNKLALTGASISSVTTTYGTRAAAGVLSFGNAVGSDSVTATVSIDSPLYSTSGNLKAGSYTQSAPSTLTGTDAGNYTFAGFTSSANYTVNKLALTVSATGANRVYDGTVNDAVTLSSSGVVSGDMVDFSDISATFADKNAGIGKAVSVSGISASGPDARNYSLNNTSAAATAAITPATLTYNADPASIIVGQTPSGLTGTVNGFVVGDSLVNSTTGTLLWSTTANASSAPGQYPINGSGLSAANYMFIEDANNATALTLKSGSLLAEVSNNTITQMDSIMLGTSQPLELNPSGTIGPVSGGGFSGLGVTVNATLSIAGTGTLNIVNGGVKLPDNMVDLNGGQDTDNSNSQSR